MNVSLYDHAAHCYHCGQPVPEGNPFPLEIDGREQTFCCPGCQAVATAIIDGGLGNFYRFRSNVSERPSSKVQDYTVYELTDIQREFVSSKGEGKTEERTAHLLLEGITCAACVWLIEHRLSQEPGVSKVSVNSNTHRCLLQWRPTEQTLSHLMAVLADIGYTPQPATQDRHQQLRRRENHQALMRLGVAGIGMMQAGMVAVGLYAGALQDMSEAWQIYLRWVSLLLVTPVVFYSARPFFQGALRVLKTRHLSMDVPVALAIGLAYLASCWATLSNRGEVYFDSVSMFTFFLLLGRYLEMRMRHFHSLETERLAQLLPLSVCRVRRLDSDGAGSTEVSESIPVKALQVGDWVRVNPGDTFACDGRVLEGRSTVVEALLTGEADGLLKQPGDKVVAGSLNQDSTLLVEATATGENTQLSTIERLVQQAQADKPARAALADRLAGYFIGVVLLTTLLVAAFWWYWQPDKAFWIALSVLVVTCPCALSLATPTALTAAVAHLRRQGLLITRAHVVETLEKVNRVVFDKTGTLTQGQPQVKQIIVTGTHTVDVTGTHTVTGTDTVTSIGTHTVTGTDAESFYLAVAAALEAGSNHPIAKAFTPYAGRFYASDLKSETAAGVEGIVNGEVFRLGTAEYALSLIDQSVKDGAAEKGFAQPEATAGQWLLLSSIRGAQAWINLQDQLRPEALATVTALQNRGVSVELLSGDQSYAVEQVAQTLGVDSWLSGVSPAQKLEHIQQAQARGDVVLMVGDGINDVPVLSAADVSVAMGSATDLAQTRSDSILLSGNLLALPAALAFALTTRNVIRQNVVWAILYNSLALPLAAVGVVPPYGAAIGMSLSSLVVVVNALRLGKEKRGG